MSKTERCATAQMHGDCGMNGTACMQCMLALAEQNLEEEEQLRTRLTELLTGTANALKGKPKPLHLHDWSDLPKVAAELTTELKKLRDKGVEEGATCGRECSGVIAFAPVENCSCHISPPCSACEGAYLHCPECGWEDA